MKRIIFKIAIISTLMLINVNVFAQTYYYLTGTSGTFSATGSAYVGVDTKI